MIELRAWVRERLPCWFSVWADGMFLAWLAQGILQSWNVYRILAFSVTLICGMVIWIALAVHFRRKRIYTDFDENGYPTRWKWEDE